ncbi:MAG TPA: HEAT repeat domain-containing protein [Fimbriimonadales bacterium]|nr:HEAT repeat domain-containing protein [Fimbriimonadales bacterium]
MKALLILTIAILAISGGSISCRNPKHAQTPKSELVRKELNKVLAAANNEDLVQATSDFDQAVENLRKIDADEAVDAIRSMFKSATPTEMRALAFVTWRLGTPRAQALLVKMARDKSPYISGIAISSLDTFMPDTEVHRVLRDALLSKNPAIKFAAANALAKWDERAIPILEETANNEQMTIQIRFLAVHSLEGADPEKAGPALKRLSKSSDRYLRLEAERILKGHEKSTEEQKPRGRR